MFLLDRQTVAASTGRGSSHPVHLRLRADGQLVELPLGKTMIGSSPRCNLRIEQPGVQPLHCLIVHGPEGLSVRRWAADTQLNGVPFDDAPLAAGDRLVLGGVELELIEPQSAAEQEEAAVEPETPETNDGCDEECVVNDECEIGSVESCTELMDAVQESVDAMSDLDEATSESVEVFGDDAELAEAAPEYLADEYAGLYDAPEYSSEWSAGSFTLPEYADEATEHAEEVPTYWNESAASYDDEESEVVDDATECLDEPCVDVYGPYECVGDDVCSDSVDDEPLAEVEVLVEEWESPIDTVEELTAEVEIPAIAEIQSIGRETIDFSPALPPLAMVSAYSVEEVELVFQELRTACANSRGRVRKMLAALRGQRDLNHELVASVTEVNAQLAELTKQISVQENTIHGEAHDRDEWRTELKALRDQFGEWRNCLTEHTERMAEVQRALAGVRANESAQAAQPQIISALPVIEAVAAPVVEPAAEATAPAYLAEAHWPPAASWLSELPAHDEVPTSNQFEAHEEVEQTVESQSEEVAEEAADPVNKVSQDIWQEPKAPGSSWLESLPSVDAQAAEDREHHWGGVSAPMSSVEAGAADPAINAEPEQACEPAWRGEVTNATEEKAADDVSPFAELSIWKQGLLQEAAQTAQVEVVEETTTVEEPSWGNRTFVEESEDIAVDPPADVYPVAPTTAEKLWSAMLSEPVVDVPEVEAPAPAKMPPTSFIERYSHLLAEDGATEAPTSLTTVTPPMNSPAVSSLRPLSAAPGTLSSTTAVNSDEEESIEQYMAKLLQRVRGDVPYVAASQGNPSTSAAMESRSAASQEVSSTATSDAQVAEPVETEEEAAQAMVNWEAIARRAAAAAPSADLGALRALANETARRAIGRHESKKHRRDATTKVILSTLAGITSLWLMLNSPSWMDLQFITGCGSLLVAAYWGGGALRMMLVTMRAATYGGPEAATAGEQGALPIDVQ